MTFRGQNVPVKELTPLSFKGIEIALFSAGGGISKEFAPLAVKAGCVVIDNSSAFRMDDSVPLVVPEVNAADIRQHQGHHRQPELHHRHHAYGALSVASGFWSEAHLCLQLPGRFRHGRQAIEELKRQVAQIVAGEPLTKEVYPHQIAFNVLPQVDVFLPNGYTKEEAKWKTKGAKSCTIPLSAPA